MIGSETYAGFLDQWYLQSFVAEGGSAVKFVVPADDAAAREFGASIVARATAAGFVGARVDAVRTRVHQIEQVFYEVARQIDWDALATRTVIRAYEAARWPVPEGGELAVGPVAAHHGADPGEVTRDVNRALQQLLQKDFAMVYEFRTAALRLCQAKLGTGQVTEAEREAVLGWLKGELRQMSLLRSAAIFRRIGRHNARHLLFSLTHWLATNGHRGLFLELDVTRLGFARRPTSEERQGFYYTKAQLLDAYELLRQLVDNTDELAHCCVVVVAAPEFLTDEARGVTAYQALKLRIHDEVRDRRRDNPSSSLVRLGPAPVAP